MRNVPEHHRSMQAVFDRSLQLYTEAERKSFPHLSVFRDGFRREAAEQVASASLVILAGLVDKSFLRLSASGRYEVQELTRQYGEEHLDAVPDTRKEAQDRQCAYYASFLHQRQAALRGRNQAAALDEIEDAVDNIRESWQWAVLHDPGRDIQQSMHSLYVFCYIRAQAQEGQRHFDLALKRFMHDDSAPLAYLLIARSSMAGFNGRWSGEIHTGHVIRGIQLAYTFWTEDEIAIQLQIYRHFREELKTDVNLRLEQLYRDFLELLRMHDQTWGAIFCFVAWDILRKLTGI